MPLLKHHRAYRGILRRLGVKGENALELSDTIRPVAIVDDLQHLQAPEQVGVYGANGFQAAVPVTFNSLALQASFPGVWVLFLGGSDATTYRAIVGNAHLNTVGAAVVPERFGSDIPHRSALNITQGVNAPNAEAPLVDGDVPLDRLFGMPIFIPGGRVIELVNAVATQANGANILWQEIPDD